MRLLQITIDYWKLLEIIVDHCRLLTITGDYWRLLQITGDYRIYVTENINCIAPTCSYSTSGEGGAMTSSNVAYSPGGVDDWVS